MKTTIVLRINRKLNRCKKQRSNKSSSYKKGSRAGYQYNKDKNNEINKPNAKHTTE